MSDEQLVHPSAGGVLIAVLATCSRLAWLSFGVLMLAGLAVLFAPTSKFSRELSLVVVLLGLIAQYYAARLYFDRQLFVALYAENADSVAFDHALEALTGKPALPARTLASRWHGVRRLIRYFLIVLTLQLAAFVIALAAAR
ncbi:hypothetical protein [Andreprevotia chitinilytica]|uniref:hypothetical protein n=1 Tax=Andreprevotia chitinilytica TaxID=396808 RepID=UPI00068EC828|nr:hypothetical protein [Andreprevotia chitinilytica]